MSLSTVAASSFYLIPAKRFEMLWRCEHCHANGVSIVRTIEEAEVDHCLDSGGCKGRCVEEREPPPPLRAYARCAKCGDLANGHEHPRSWVGGERVLFVFEHHGERAEASADRMMLCLQNRGGFVLFSECFGSKTPALLHINR